jgi:hypothetical protein
MNYKAQQAFQFMAYPNRSHGIYEGEGTCRHLNTSFYSMKFWKTIRARAK